jgi:hypothetical protein
VKWLGLSCPRRCRGGGKGRTVRRRYGGRVGKLVGRTAARGCGGANGEVVAGGAAAEKRDDGELVLAGVRAAMATAFRGLGMSKWQAVGWNRSKRSWEYWCACKHRSRHSGWSSPRRQLGGGRTATACAWQARGMPEREGSRSGTRQGRRVEINLAGGGARGNHADGERRRQAQSRGKAAPGRGRRSSRCQPD